MKKKKAIRKLEKLRKAMLDVQDSVAVYDFPCLRDGTDAARLADTVVCSTAGTAPARLAPLERTLLCAIISYLLYHIAPEDRHFGSVVSLLLASAQYGTHEKSTLDALFDDAALSDPDGFALRQYRIFMLAPAADRAACTASAAISPSGTIRCLSPLPITRTNCSSK